MNDSFEHTSRAFEELGTIFTEAHTPEGTVPKELRAAKRKIRVAGFFTKLIAKLATAIIVILFVAIITPVVIALILILAGVLVLIAAIAVPVAPAVGIWVIIDTWFLGASLMKKLDAKSKAKSQDVEK